MASPILNFTLPKATPELVRHRAEVSEKFDQLDLSCLHELTCAHFERALIRDDSSVRNFSTIDFAGSEIDHPEMLRILQKVQDYANVRKKAVEVNLPSFRLCTFTPLTTK